jgi:class 3 adenylate cyclase
MTELDARGGIRTFLFTDIEGSTRSSRRSGPSATPRSASGIASICASWPGRRRGIEQGTEGDSFFVPSTGDRAARRRSPASARSATSRGRTASSQGPDGHRHRRARRRRGGRRGSSARHQPRGRIAAVAHGGQILIDGATSQLLRRRLPPDVTCATSARPAQGPARAVRSSRSIVDGLPSEFPPLRTPTRTRTTCRPS